MADDRTRDDDRARNDDHRPSQQGYSPYGQQNQAPNAGAQGPSPYGPSGSDRGQRGYASAGQSQSGPSPYGGSPQGQGQAYGHAPGYGYGQAHNEGAQGGSGSYGQAGGHGQTHGQGQSSGQAGGYGPSGYGGGAYAAQSPGQGQSYGQGEMRPHVAHSGSGGYGGGAQDYGGHSTGYSSSQTPTGSYTGQTGTGYGRSPGPSPQQGEGLWDKAKSFFTGDQTEGSHRGRGPKSYSRSDERIRDDVNDRLTDDPFLDATHIEVAVEKAEVTLTGSVSSRADKRRAEDLTDNVSGVKHVQNNLRVEGAGSGGATPEGAPRSGSGEN